MLWESTHSNPSWISRFQRIKFLTIWFWKGNKNEVYHLIMWRQEWNVTVNYDYPITDICFFIAGGGEGRWAWKEYFISSDCWARMPLANGPTILISRLMEGNPKYVVIFFCYTFIYRNVNSRKKMLLLHKVSNISSDPNEICYLLSPIHPKTRKFSASSPYGIFP